MATKEPYRRALMAWLSQLEPSDARAIARLATGATTGVSRVVEGVHQSVLGSLGLPSGGEPGRTRGLTGLVYRGVRGVTGLVDTGLQAGFQRLEGLMPGVQAGSTPQARVERDAVVSALNGVLGDALAQDGNPLAIRMGWYRDGVPLDFSALPRGPDVSGKLLVLVHGLCMNDLQWLRHGHDHGASLASAHGLAPVYLRYNTGLHTSDNGALLSGCLDQLVAAWPVPVQSITVLAHSMGGLVARSACHHAEAANARWRPLLRHLICLGTPHHGAPLERAGNGVDRLLDSFPYTRPFGRLAQLRSAGITDLRWGHVTAADWLGRSRFARSPDRRVAVPLPSGVACYTVAAALASQRSPWSDRLVGDGLVPLHSALGVHPDPARTLDFDRSHQSVLHRLGHLDLLSDPRVARRLTAWLGETP